MFDDTSLIRMVIDKLSKIHRWTYDETLDKFYKSKVCKGISDKRTGMFTFSVNEIIELFEDEISCKQND